MTAPAALIALDWGSSSLRAFLMGGGEVLAARESPLGASTLPPGAMHFDRALHDLVGDWLGHLPGAPVLACGMVGSAHGWREAPYMTCPADTARLHASAVEAPAGSGARVLIVPGLIHTPDAAAPDVMRGEETQIAGVLALRPALAEAACIVLPGTHSKWAMLREGCVTGFATRMTGELFAVLRQHSVLGRLMTAPTAFDAAAFDAGLDAAHRTGGRDLGHQLFAVRTLGLTGRWPGEALGDYLSGLLIGHELAAGLADADAAGIDGPLPLVLVGEAALCERYRHALLRRGRAPAEVFGNTAAAGLWRVACAAGLVHPHKDMT